MEKPMGWVQPREGEMGTEAETLRSALPVELEKGVCYLVKEKKPELSYRLFETLVAQKIPGLCITRQYPERVRRERRPSPVPGVLVHPPPRGGLPHPPPDRDPPEGNHKVHRGKNARGGVLLHGIEH